MKKKLWVSFAALLLAATLNGCTSGDSTSEEDAELVSNAEIEEVEGGDVAIETTESAELSEALPENSLADTSAIGDSDLNLDHSSVAQVERVDESTSVTVDETPSFEPLVTDATPTETIQNTPEPSFEPAPIAQESSSMAKSDAPKKTIAPLQKITSAPYMVDSKWVNAVYIARPGDSLKAISKKIYGDDRSKELKKINTVFKSRSVKPGDKIYYNSPIRPDDSSKVSFYYEENGIPSQMYVAQKGENIRKVSKTLLGYENAWKEVWATNTVESKGVMQEGEMLRYWPETSVPVPTLAQAEKTFSPPPPAPSMAPPPPDMAMNVPPPPPPDMMPPPDMAMNVPPPPPPDMMPPPDMGHDPMAAGSMDLPPPPPDMHNDIPPPPPVAEAPRKQTQNMHEEAEVSEGMDVQSMGLLGAIGLFAIALIMIIVKRKKKQREQEALMSETHVGSM